MEEMQEQEAVQDEETRDMDRQEPEPQPEPKPEEEKVEVARMSLEQYCTAKSMSVPVESLSVFLEVMAEEGHYVGTFEEFQQRLHEFMNRPL